MIVNFLQLYYMILLRLQPVQLLVARMSRKQQYVTKNRIHAIRSVRVACTFFAVSIFSFLFSARTYVYLVKNAKILGDIKQRERTNLTDVRGMHTQQKRHEICTWCVNVCVRMHWRCVWLKERGLRRERRKKALCTPWHRVPLSGQWRWVNGYTRRSSKLQTMRSKCA